METCSSCGGTGTYRSISTGLFDPMRRVRCPDCRGTGQRGFSYDDPTDRYTRTIPGTTYSRLSAEEEEERATETRSRIADLKAQVVRILARGGHDDSVLNRVAQLAHKGGLLRESIGFFEFAPTEAKRLALLNDIRYWPVTWKDGSPGSYALHLILEELGST